MDAKRESIRIKLKLFCDDKWDGPVTDEMTLCKFLMKTYPFLSVKRSRCKHHDYGIIKPDGKCALCEFERKGKLSLPGELSARKKAIITGQKWYMSVYPCSKCGVISLRLVSNGRCLNCRPFKTDNSAYKDAVRRGDKWYTPEYKCPECHTCSPRRTSDKKCSGCYPDIKTRSVTSPRQLALRAGQTWYTPDTPCTVCGTYAERRVDNGQCSHCVPRKAVSDAPSARQIAMRNGEKWYIPETPCKHCGKLEQRYVANGRCKCQNKSVT